MICGSCGSDCKDEDITWVRGTAVCQACVKQGVVFRKWFFRGWLVLVILMLLAPIVLCAGGFLLFRFFQQQ